MKKFDLITPSKRTKGYTTWTNPINGFLCIDLHYAADPAKDSEEWKKAEFVGMSRDNIEREYELNWEISSDKPVYGKSFNKNLHIAPEAIVPKPGLPIFRGWDFGLNQCCIVTQFYNNRLHVLREYITEGETSETAVPAILSAFKRDFGDTYFCMDVIDPAGAYSEQSTTSTCYKVLVQNKVENIVLGEQNPEARRNAVKKLLSELHEGKSRFISDPRNKVLNAGFTSGYKYRKVVKGADSTHNDKPVKNQFSHIHDALQYVCTRLTSFANMMKSGFANVRIPSKASYRL